MIAQPHKVIPETAGERENPAAAPAGFSTGEIQKNMISGFHEIPPNIVQRLEAGRAV